MLCAGVAVNNNFLTQYIYTHALTQNIIIHKILKKPSPENISSQFQVKGSEGKTYNVTMDCVPHCSCKDYKKQVCIFFLLDFNFCLKFQNYGF